MAVERRRDFDASCDLMLPISAVVLNPGGVDISWEGTWPSFGLE